jgi:predicted transcriptional regulator
MSQTITVRLNEELSSWLEETAARTGVSQGQIVREQLAKAKNANANRAFMRWAGVVRGPKNLSSRKGFSDK